MRRRRVLCAAITLPVATSKAANSVEAVAGQRPAVGQLQIALRALQRLDRGLLVDADHDRVFRRRQVQADHIGGLGGKVGVVALAPGLAPGEVDLLCPQDAPDLLLVHIAEFSRQQRPGPAPIALGRRPVQQRQDAPRGRLAAVFAFRATARTLLQPGKAFPRIAAAPQTHRARHRAELACDRARRAPLGRHQNNPCPQHIALRRRRRAEPSLKHHALLRPQPDLSSFAYHSDVESRITQLR